MALSDKQKWMIGCGGCLGLILLVVVLLTIGWNLMMSMGQDNAKAVFGQRLPEGYITLGLPTAGKAPGHLVVMVNQKTRLMLFGVETAQTETLTKIMQSDDPKEVQPLLEKWMQEDLEGGSASDNQPEQIVLEHIRRLNAETGSDQSLKTYEVRLISKDKSELPAVATMVRQPNRRVVVLAGADPVGASLEPGSDFTASYQKISHELMTIIQNTELSNNILAPALPSEPSANPSGAAVPHETSTPAARPDKQ